MSTNTDFDTDISSDPALAALDFDDIVIPQDDEPEAAPTIVEVKDPEVCLLYTSPSPRDRG